MSTKVIAPFDDPTVTAVARAVGELFTGPELSALLGEAKLPDPRGEGSTKWRRLHDAITEHQNRHRNGKATIAVVTAAMKPTRTLDRVSAAAVARDSLDQALSLWGLKVDGQGRVARTARAATDNEARARATRLRGLLETRGVHQAVLDGVRQEWLKADCYDAVFESVKLLGDRLRQMTGLDLDGHKLVDAAFTGSTPRLRINDYVTSTERNEQLGVASLARGLFSAMRNPQAHEPRSKWTMTEQDALDVLGTLSLIHRRLDDATTRDLS